MSWSAPKLFVAYRREVTASYAGRLYDAMAAEFGASNVFMDIQLEPGIDFVERIVEVVSACHVFLVIIEPTWATSPNREGRPRIADAEDYVRLEVETALRRREVRVIPLLVAGARMPQPEELPEELRALTRRNALELSDVRWHHDVGRLTITLKELLETAAVPFPPPARAIEASAAPTSGGVKAADAKSSRREHKLGAEIAGHRLEAIIGHGDTGVVYRARDLRLDRAVALKVIATEFAENRDFRRRFKRESQQVASIGHPSILPVHRVVDEGDLLFITMECVKGTDLATFIGVRGQLDPRLAASVASQVAAGLEAAHARGLVHGDVRSANVLIDGQERVYLTGFGVTKRGGPGSALKNPDVILGTTDYLAPEQIQGDKLDARADVYGLGCVLYEALTGFVPYPRQSAAETMRAHVSDAPPSVHDRAPDVPMEFDIVVRRALAKEPDQRFMSAEAMRRGIDAAASRRGQAQRMAGTSEDPGQRKPWRPPWRDSRMLIAFAALGLALVFAAVLLVTRGGGEDPPTSNGLASVPGATELPDDLEWRLVRHAPFRRQYAASTAVDGKVLVFGGLGPDATWSSTGTKVYDPAQDTWETGSGLPRTLHHAMAVTYQGDAVVMGGFVQRAGQLTSVESDRVYRLQGETWVEWGSLEHPRAAAAAAVVGDKIVVVGGQADGELVAQSEMFDGEHWSEVAPMPTLREHLGAASDGRYLYAVGGRELTPAKNVPALERYDPVNDSWTKLESMPAAIGGVGVAYVGGRVIAVGGENPNRASAAVQAYDIQKQTWSPLPDLPNARHGMAVTVLDNALYAIGGAADAGHVDSRNDAAVLDFAGSPAARPRPDDLQWLPIHDAPFRRQYAASTAVRGRVLLAGGMGETGSAETARYDRVLNLWTPGPQLPRTLHHAMAVTYQGDAVVMGGFVQRAGQLTSVESDRVYRLQGETWVEWGSLEHPRAAAAAAVVGDKIVVVGGQADGELVAQSEMFDGEHWSEVAPMPTLREHLGAASDGRYLYAVGGRELTPAKNVPALERYDPVNDSWTKLESMPAAIGGVGVAYVGGRVIAVGGENPNRASAAVQAYDIQKQTWSPLPDLPNARHGMAVTVLDNALYAIGGAADAGHVDSTQDAHVLGFD